MTPKSSGAVSRQPPAGRWSRFLTVCRRPKVWLLVAIAIAIGVGVLGPWGDRLNHDALVMQLEEWGMWAPALFVVAHVVATMLGVPGTVLTIAGGAVFGLWWGTVWSVVGATLGSTGAFLLARYLLHEWAAKRYGNHPLLLRLNQSITNHAFKLILTVRLMPISPFNLVNFLFGLTPASLMAYCTATGVGIIPGTALYTWIGDSGRELVSGGDKFPFGIAVAFLTLLSVLPFCVKRWR